MNRRTPKPCTVCSLAMSLASVVATTPIGCCSHPSSSCVPAETQATELLGTLGDGQRVPLLDIPWLIGEWHSAHTLDDHFVVNRESTGVYVMTSTSGNSEDALTLTVFGLGDRRMVEMSRRGAHGAENTTFAILSGNYYRFSLDVLPAVFPGAWSDAELLKHAGAQRCDAVPVGERSRSLRYLITQLDTKGTLMGQDLTYFRDE